MNNLFFSEEFQMANYKYDCCPCDLGTSTADILNKLEEQSISLIDWYKYNYLKPNPDKWHFILSERRSNSYMNMVNTFLMVKMKTY